MSLKQEIETWVQALAHYDNNEFEESLKVFDNISDTSKILFNCGVIHATLGEHEKAVECYQRCIQLDKYLAVAYFQQGVSNFLIGDFEEALANFNDTLLYLRGNTYIDYEQLGLKFRLYSCEVLFNRGLCYIYLQQNEAGMKDFEFAVKEKVTPDHEVIDEAIREQAEGYTVFSIPVGVLYRPNEAKVKNLKTKDYLGKARLVAASDRSNAFTGFAGSEKKAALVAEPRARDDRPTENISFAASNLVQPGLTSRGGREQSAPPAMNRNMFPPTPPPENDKPAGPSSAGPTLMTGRAASVRNPPNRPPALQRTGTILSSMSDPMSISSTERAPPPITEEPRTMVSPRQRMGTMRTASEPRGPTVRRGPSQSRPTLYRETTDESMTDLYDMYQTPPAPKGLVRRGTTNNMGGNRQQPAYIDEEEEYMSDAYENDDFMQDDGVDFEMVGGSGARPGMQARRPSGNHRSSTRRLAEVKKIRVKVHSNAETRYIMIGPAVEYADFEGKVREKFGLRRRLRVQMQDDGDMITMGDQDDLDMLIESAKSAARREKQDMGKMEVWIHEV
ncbi:hypothetical protein GJ744_006336 [Endocarpon pusillum]|uniref:PB1 domain-containing protein n=1 Tax=Endocarpon pusillum TaxID=364733 RepID=A0A8H7E6R2_9EURO|nr:hypothetical protein GJ744_006336 [Endocarpon pusillum]